MTENLSNALIDDGVELRENPDELRKIIEDSRFKYYRSKSTKFIFFSDIILLLINFVLVIIEYEFIFRSGDFYKKLTLKTRILPMKIFFIVTLFFLLLFIVLLILSLVQKCKSYLYLSRHNHKRRLNFYGILSIFFLINNIVLIISSVLAMREFMGPNCNYNENGCVTKFCFGDMANEFAQYYHFNMSDKDTCKITCSNFIVDKCSNKSIFSYFVTIISCILLLLSIILTKKVCMKD